MALHGIRTTVYKVRPLEHPYPASQVKKLNPMPGEIIGKNVDDKPIGLESFFVGKFLELPLIVPGVLCGDGMEIDWSRVEKVRTQLDSQEMTARQLADVTGLKFYEIVNVINVLTYISRIYEYDGVDGVAIYGMAK